jgi:hypothetical protein
MSKKFYKGEKMKTKQFIPTTTFLFVTIFCLALSIISQNTQATVYEGTEDPNLKEADCASEVLTATAQTSVLGIGGPDAGGYYYFDNQEAGGPAFDWIEISGTGTNLNLGDDGHYFPISLPFNFDFYGVNYSQIAVGSNGTVYFEDDYLGLSNICIPGISGYGVDSFIAVYWDDLCPDSSGNVYYKIVGSAPNRKLIVQWQNVRHYGTSDTLTAQAQLSENGDILLLYADPSSEAGVSGTVGIQNDTQTGLQYLCTESGLPAGLAVLFTRNLGCREPESPEQPQPEDGTMDVPVNTILEWNGGGGNCDETCGVENGGFETGEFAPWIAETNYPTDQLTDWNIGIGDRGHFQNGFPFEGNLCAQNGFDGEEGLYYDLYQETAIPACAPSAILTWSERIQWNMVSYGATLPREYTVSIQPAGGGAPLAIVYSMLLNPGTEGDTGYVTHSVDLLELAPAIAGQTVRISFYEYIPEYETGPAQFDLDGISLVCGGQALSTGTQDAEQVIDASDRGWWRDDGNHNASNKNTITGQNGSGTDLFNSFFVFDLTSVPPSSFTGATLRLEIENYYGPDASESLTIYDVSTPTSVLTSSGSNVAVFNDLGSGNSYGNFTVLRTDEGSILEITLNNQALADIAATTGGFFAVGLHVNDIGLSSGDEGVRFSSSDEARVHQLVLTTTGGGGGGDPSVTYDVYLGTDPSQMDLVATDLEEPVFNPCILSRGTTYYWQVISRNDCGQTAGPIWSFTTEAWLPQPEDGAIDIPINTLLEWNAGDGNCDETCDIENGGFETGAFDPWVAVTGPGEVILPWTVLEGIASEGIYSAANIFEGDAGLFYDLYQEVEIPGCAPTAIFTWSEILYWELAGGTLPREYTISIQPAGGGTPLAILHSQQILPGTSNTDALYMNYSVDLLELAPSIAGQTVRINFHQYMPESFTGYAVLVLDGVSLTCGGEVVTAGPQSLPLSVTDLEDLVANYEPAQQQVTATSEDEWLAAHPGEVFPLATSGSGGSPAVTITTGELIGVDFDERAGSPTNWTTTLGGSAPISLLNLLNESGTPTVVDIELASTSGAFSDFSTTPNPSTIPTHTNVLTGLNDYFYGGGVWTFTFSDLLPGDAYNVYVFGLRGFVLGNDVAISGGSPSIHFVQSSTTAGNLWINGELGSNTRTLQSFAEPMTADGSGEITITVVGMGDTAAIAGLAIEPTMNSSAVTYDVYLGTDPSQMELVATDLEEPVFNPCILDYETTYYWQVISRNDCGQAAGPIWSFTTEAWLPQPEDGAMDVPINMLLAWNGSSSGGGGGGDCDEPCGVENGGFETGQFAPWVAVTGPGNELTEWNVGTGDMGWFGNGLPFEGELCTQNGFDGSAGLFYDLYQETAIPACAPSAILTWSERIQWDMHTFDGSTLPREYIVSVQPVGGGAPLAIVYSTQLEPGTQGDTGYVTHSVDLLGLEPAIAGQMIRISFYQYIPENMTGPAQFDLDGISLMCGGATLINTSQGSPEVQTLDAPDIEEYNSLREAALATPASQTVQTTFTERMVYEGVEDPALKEADCAVEVSTTAQSVPGIGGPDAGGYYYFDNQEAGGPAFDWIEISGTGTNLNLTDDSYSSPISLPFGFDFYETDYTQITVGSNGGVYFENRYLTLGNGCIPGTNSSGINSFIAVYWDDLYPGGSDNVYYKIVGSAPNRKLIVQWQNVRHCCGSANGVVTAQAQLSENGDILLLYADPSSEAGSSGTVGIQNSPTVGLQYLCNERALSAGLAVLFTRNPDGPDTEIPITYDVYLGTDISQMERVGVDLEEPVFNPCILDYETTYYWQVTARNDCGQTTGPIWSFTTEAWLPQPEDGAMDVPIETLLEWNGSSSGNCDEPCGVENGGFETGEFDPWVAVTGPGQQLTEWNIGIGSRGWFDGFPFEGNLCAQNGFDGDAGLFYDLYQETTIPACAPSAILTWSERIQWNMVSYGATLPREYTVSVQPAGGGAPLAVVYSMQLEPGTQGDTGYVTHSVDLLDLAPAIAGQTVRINFHQYIPESLTGPAQFDLDGISLTCGGEVLINTSQGQTLNTSDIETRIADYEQIRQQAIDAAQQVRNECVWPSAVETQTVLPETSVGSVALAPSDGQIINGDFETGTMDGWTLLNIVEIPGYPGTFGINDGTFRPDGPDDNNPLLPYSGSFSAISHQIGPGLYTIYQDVSLPANATSSTLRWADMIRNHHEFFEDPDQEFRVEIWDLNNQPLAALFSTNPGDPRMTDWTERDADLMPFAGQMVRIAFTVDVHLNYFNVHLDNIRIEIESTPPTSPLAYDVYFGLNPDSPDTWQLIDENLNTPMCDPTPGPGEVLRKGRVYYWQVVAKNECGQVTSPVWSFTTENTPPVADAGDDQTVFCWIDGLVNVTLDGSGSYDEDENPITYLWTWTIDNQTYTATGISPTITLPAGVHTITLVVNDSIDDSQPDEVVIIAEAPIVVSVNCTPKSLNCESNGNWVMAHFVLPPEYGLADVNTSVPCTLEPLGLSTSRIDPFINEDGLVQVDVSFDRNELCETDPPLGFNQMMPTGSLISGHYFYGVDEIRILDTKMEHLINLAENWLEVDCGQPHWCNGQDINADGVVDMRDFVLID